MTTTQTSAARPMRVLIGYDGSDCARAAIADLARAGMPERAEAVVLAAADLPAHVPYGAAGDLTPQPLAPVPRRGRGGGRRSQGTDARAPARHRGGGRVGPFAGGGRGGGVARVAGRHAVPARDGGGPAAGIARELLRDGTGARRPRRSAPL